MKSQKVNRNKELVRNTAYLTIGKISTQFISFLLLPLYTSVLSTEEYGTVDLINTYQQLLVFVVFLQIEQGVFRHLIDTRKNNNEEQQKAIISTATVIAIVSSCFFAVAYGLLHGYINSNYTIFILTNVLAVSVSGLTLQIARGFGDNVSYVLGSFISALTTILCNIVFVGFLRIGPGGMLTSILIGNVVCTITIIVRCKLYNYLSFRKATKHVAVDLLKYSIPLVPNAIAWWVISASDRTVVLFYLGASFNGLLAISHKFSTVFSSLFQIFNLSWTESAALHINDEDSAEFFSNVINKSLILFGSLCVGIIAFMPFVFPILVNERYGEAYYQIPLFMIAALFNTVQGLYSVIYIALKQTKKVMLSTVAAAVINVLTGVLLVQRIGLYAAPVSTIIAYVTIIVYRYSDLRKSVALKLDFKSLLQFSVIAAITLFTYYTGDILAKGIVCILVVIVVFKLNSEFINGLLGNIVGKFRTRGK